MRIISPRKKIPQNKNTIIDRRISFSGLRKKSAAVSGSVRISLVSLVFVVLGLIAFSGIFYLYQVNSMATKGIEIKKAEQEIKKLKQEGEELKIKEAEQRSMDNIEKEVKNLDLVGAAEISYVEVSGPVAMR